MAMVRRFLPCVSIALAVAVASAGCGQARQSREYPLKGQILAIGAARNDGRRELSVKHEDLPGFMPAMTMAYFVRTPALLDGLVPGDFITARLVVNGGEIYLDQVAKTGHANLPADAKPVKAMDVMEP